MVPFLAKELVYRKGVKVRQCKHRRKAKVPQPLGLRDSRIVLAVWTRLELATPCVTGMYSNQLNYQTLSFDTLRRLPVVGGANIRSLLTMVAKGTELFPELLSFKGNFHEVFSGQHAELQRAKWPFACI